MQNQLEDRAYAGFFVRLAAFMVDFVIAAMVGGMLKAPFATAATLGLSGLKANFLFQYSFVDIVGYLGQAAYFVLMTWFNHATLGKMLMRLEVVTEEKEWTFVNVLYRETVGRFLSSILMAGYLVVLGHSKKQGFHDMLCDTFVVYKNMALRPAKTREEPAAALTGSGAMAELPPLENVNTDGTPDVTLSGTADGMVEMELSEKTDGTPELTSTLSGEPWTDQ